MHYTTRISIQQTKSIQNKGALMHCCSCLWNRREWAKLSHVCFSICLVRELYDSFTIITTDFNQLVNAMW